MNAPVTNQQLTLLREIEDKGVPVHVRYYFEDLSEIADYFVQIADRNRDAPGRARRVDKAVAAAWENAAFILRNTALGGPIRPTK